MKRHLTDGELRASLDGELDEGPMLHLDAWPGCQTRLLQLKQEHLRSAKRLSFLTPRVEPVPSARSAWSRFTQEYLNQKETSMFKKMFAFPVVRVGAIAVLLMALLMAFPTTRSLCPIP